jgi:hypothetical protein
MNAAIWYSTTCRLRRLTPAYINIRINGNNQQCQRTLRTATKCFISQEIRFLYTKKLKLNEQLFKLHLECARRWQYLWPIILQTIDNKLAQEMEAHYNNLNCKLDTLQNKQQRTNNNLRSQQFQTRRVNLTQIKFLEEMNLLNNGLQHSIEKPLDKYRVDLITETEQAIRMLDTKMQAPFRILATKELKQIKASGSHLDVTFKQQSYILKKLAKENAMLVKANKGKTCVITYTDDYTAKDHNFLYNNNFQTLRTNPTDMFQKLITKALQQFHLIVNKKQLKYLIQKNPQRSTLKAQIKIHEPDNRIRPVVNNIKSPTYKISKLLVNKLNEYLNFGHHYNVKDSVTLAHDLIKLKIDENYRMKIFNIKFLYVNIPIKETLRITKTLLSQYNNEHITKKIITLQ